MRGSLVAAGLLLAASGGGCGGDDDSTGRDAAGDIRPDDARTLDDAATDDTSLPPPPPGCDRMPDLDSTPCARYRLPPYAYCCNDMPAESAGCMGKTGSGCDDYTGPGHYWVWCCPGPGSADADAGGDAGGDVADGADDADADAGVACVPGSEPSGTWCDPVSGLTWQAPPDATQRTWDEGLAYCDGLSLGGLDDWRLPTVGELRSLVRGCPATEAGGACGVTDGCLGDDCFTEPCAGCPPGGGPGGAGGAYLPEGLGCNCLRDLTGLYCPYWSSSSQADGVSSAWRINFINGAVRGSDKTNAGFVRCVRRGS